jgi:nucleotide-binding universal stress UspA family protein
MSEPVIVGIDPERQDSSPLRLAVGLARVTGAPLVAVASHTGEVDEADRWARLESLATGVDAELEVLAGPSPGRVLIDVASARGASLIVVGSMQEGWLGRLAPSTTSERLLAGAPCPIAIARPGIGEAWTPRRVGVGFVDRDEGHDALRSAAALAAAVRAPLHALTAVEPLDWSRMEGLEAALVAAKRALYQAIENVPRGIEARREVVVRPAADALITLSTDIDLLFCGSRESGPVRSVALGSVTRGLTRSAACPVVIVPRGVRMTWQVAAGPLHIQR